VNLPKRALLLSVGLVALLAGGIRRAGAGEPPQPMHVAGRFLVDAHGERVVLRGVNKMVIWVDVPHGSDPFPQIGLTGANVTRIVWNDTGTAAALDRMISLCLAAHMIPMVEDHDATGDLSRLPRVVAYWTRPDVVAVLEKHREYLLLNIANEAGDKLVTDDAFVAAYTLAVRALRTAGLTVPLVVDAPDWGKNLELLLRVADRLTAIDPMHDLLFSVHLYWRYSRGRTDDEVTRKLHESVVRKIPLLVGEFSSYVTDGSSDTDSVRYRNILARCAADDIGWIVWEWGPGNTDETTGRPMPWMGMTTDGTFHTLNGWGKDVAIDDPNGIARTAHRPAGLAGAR
jgi:mannan endo-1,4-beta-mannosidase